MKSEYTKKNFTLRDKVIFINTGGPLDGITGMIVGKRVDVITDDYIVLLDEEYSGQLAIPITEACLEKI